MENVGLWILLKNAPQLHRGALGTDGQSKETWPPVWLVLNTLCDHHSVWGSDEVQSAAAPVQLPMFKSWFHHLLAV